MGGYSEKDGKSFYTVTVDVANTSGRGGSLALRIEDRPVNRPVSPRRRLAPGPGRELYDLLQRGLAYLGAEGANKRGVLHYEREMARLLGVAHDRTSAALAIEQAFGSLPRGRSACMDAVGG